MSENGKAVIKIGADAEVKIVDADTLDIELAEYETIDESDNNLYRSCEIEIHSSKCVQAVADNKKLWAIHKYEPYEKYPPLTSEDTDRISVSG